MKSELNTYKITIPAYTDTPACTLIIQAIDREAAYEGARHIVADDGIDLDDVTAYIEDYTPLEDE